MKRMVLVILVLALLPAGMLIGYRMNTNKLPPPAPTPIVAPPSGTGDASVIDLGCQVNFEDGPLKSVIGAETLGRYKGGPAWVHVQYFVDFEQEGVKKRAFFQAFNFSPPSEGLGNVTEKYYDVRNSEGVIVLDKQSQLRTVNAFKVTTKRPKEPKAEKIESITVGWGAEYSSWNVFDAYQPIGMDPQRVLVLDFDKCDKTTLYDTPRFRLATDILDIGTWVSFAGGEGYTGKTTTASFAGTKGVAAVFCFISGTHYKAPANEDTCEAEVAKRRQDLAVKPDDPVLKWKLAWAIDYKRGFSKETTLDMKYTLAQEAVKFVRAATKQEPANMFYRAEERRLLFRQASLMTEGKHAREFPKVIEEMLALVPLSSDEYRESAQLLVKWKDPALQKDLPHDEKTRIIEKTDAKVVKLLRYHAETWRNHPEAVNEKLQSIQKDAAGKSYTETPEFKKLLQEMRSWSKQG